MENVVKASKWIPSMKQEKADAERRLDELRPADRQERQTYLDRLIAEWTQGNRLLEPQVFVSFAGETGAELHRIAIPIVRGSAVTSGGARFVDSSGMRRTGDPNVIEHITLLMRPCFGFLGILTAEYPLADDQHSLPGSWVIYETGMALALGLRCVLLIEEGIHADVWRKPVGHVRHVFFKKADFRMRMTNAMGLFREYYQKDIALASPSHVVV